MIIKAVPILSKLLIVLVWATALSISAFGQNVPSRVMPADFKSDGCSLFPDGDYRNCCVEHDKVYYFGGTKEERRVADRHLFTCVRARGHRFLAPMMYLGVRIGGGAWLPTPFRWGFGNKNGIKRSNK
jgi:hypothetical protein